MIVTRGHILCEPDAQARLSDDARPDDVDYITHKLINKIVILYRNCDISEEYNLNDCHQVEYSSRTRCASRAT